MKILLSLCIIALTFSGCGKKDTPEYQSQNIYSKNIYNLKNELFWIKEK